MTAVEEPVTTVPVERKPFRDELQEYIGWRIRGLRIGQCWTQTDLAVQLDRHAATVSGWEAGTKVISVSALCAVADVLGVSPRWFLPLDGGDE